MDATGGTGEYNLNGNRYRSHEFSNPKVIRELVVLLP